MPNLLYSLEEKYYFLFDCMAHIIGFFNTHKEICLVNVIIHFFYYDNNANYMFVLTTSSLFVLPISWTHGSTHRYLATKGNSTRLFLLLSLLFCGIVLFVMTIIILMDLIVQIVHCICNCLSHIVCNFIWLCDGVQEYVMKIQTPEY